MPPPTDQERQTIKWLSATLVLGAVLVLLPIGSWLLVAAWTAMLARNVHVPLTARLGNRPRLAAVTILSMFTMLLVPAALLLGSLVADSFVLLERLLASDRAREVLAQLVGSDATPRRFSDVVALVMNQGERAWSLARHIAGTAMHVGLGLFILLSATYVFLVDGDHCYRWIETHAPMSPPAVRRLANAFAETGHGLIVGIAGAGIAQAFVATIIYVAIGVPQPFALGLLTFVFSVLPAVGTAIVWLPVSAGLIMTGRPVAAVLLMIAGVALIGSIDNVLRPYITRRGHLQLPTFIVLLSMIGGVELMGGWGLIVGPLIVRLAKEVVEMRADVREK